MNLIQDKARAYVYSGDWVADCTRTGCANVEHLFTKTHPNGPRMVPKPFFTCSHCGQEAQIDWPPTETMHEILAALAKRPIPGNRNWYPRDHETAVRFGVAHGQTVEELREESRANGIEDY